MSERRSAAPRERPDLVLFGDFVARGGTERRFANSIREWLALGYRVQIVGHRTAVPFYQDDIAAAEFVHLGTTRRLASVLALWRHLRRVRPRVAIATGHISNTVLALTRRLPPTGARLYLNVPNDFVGSQKDPSGKRKARKLTEVRRLYPLADGVIAGSQGVIDNLVRGCGLAGVATHVIYNGSLTDAVLEQAAAPVDHPWLWGGERPPVVLAVGRLAAQKDYPTLLRAFALARARMPMRLIVLGEGPERETLEELVATLGLSEDVALPGYVENPYSWMRHAALFALSSRWEGFPNVLAEALGLGVRAVSTDCPSGPREILAHGRLGGLVAVGDEQALADAIVASLRDGPICYDPAEVRRPFTAAYAAQRYLEVCGLAAGEVDGFHNEQAHP